jgi:hypothetical protein
MRNKKQPIVQSSDKINRTIRLTFSYEGNNVRLISRQSVNMIPPPSDPLNGYEGQAGFWYLLTDTKGRTLYRRVIENPIKFDVEVFSDDPKVSITRRKLDSPRGIFVLLVPEIREAHWLVLVSSPLEPEIAAEPAKELVRFDLTREAQGKEAK